MCRNVAALGPPRPRVKLLPGPCLGNGGWWMAAGGACEAPAFGRIGNEKAVAGHGGGGSVGGSGSGAGHRSRGVRLPGADGRDQLEHGAGGQVRSPRAAGRGLAPGPVRRGRALPLARGRRAGGVAADAPGRPWAARPDGGALRADQPDLLPERGAPDADRTCGADLRVLPAGGAAPGRGAGAGAAGAGSAGRSPRERLGRGGDRPGEPLARGIGGPGGAPGRPPARRRRRVVGGLPDGEQAADRAARSAARAGGHVPAG